MKTIYIYSRIFLDKIWPGFINKELGGIPKLLDLNTDHIIKDPIQLKIPDIIHCSKEYWINNEDGIKDIEDITIELCHKIFRPESIKRSIYTNKILKYFQKRGLTNINTKTLFFEPDDFFQRFPEYSETQHNDITKIHLIFKKIQVINPDGSSEYSLILYIKKIIGDQVHRIDQDQKSFNLLPIEQQEKIYLIFEERTLDLPNSYI